MIWANALLSEFSIYAVHNFISEEFIFIQKISFGFSTPSIYEGLGGSGRHGFAIKAIKAHM